MKALSLCTVCATEYTKTGMYQKYCTPCSKIRRDERNRGYPKKAPDAIRKAELKVYQRAYQQRYRQSEKYRAYERAYRTKRRTTDVNFKIAYLLRQRIFHAVKRNQKGGSAVSDLGCSVSELRAYFESKFRPGMSWENHGKWHIDHIKPLSKFDLTDRQQFLAACHYTNLQPLWAMENIIKNNRV